MMFTPDLQVIVLADCKGSKIPELLCGKPKCLLPVGPKPLIWYTLYKIQSMGFNECIVIVLDNEKIEIQEAVENCGLSINVVFHTIPHDEDFGSADSLRSVHQHIHSDVLILPCDLLTNINFGTIIMKFKAQEATLIALYLQPQSYDGIALPGPKTSKEEKKDIIMVDKDTHRIVLASTGDYETHFDLKDSISIRYPECVSYTNLLYSHLLVMKKWVVDYLVSQESVEKLEDEFLPQMIRKHLISPKANDKIFEYIKSGKRVLYNRFPDDIIRCFAHIAVKEDLAIKVNTLGSFNFANSKLTEIWHKIAPNKELILRSPRAEINSSQVDSKTVIWENAKLNGKTSFTNSVIGPNVEIGSYSRIRNCILMKNVVIKEKVALENCIVSNNAVVESGSQLNSCLIGCNQIIPAESKHNNEILPSSVRMME